LLVILGTCGLACAQNDARDFEELKPPVVFQEGFFGIEKSKEGSWHWLGDLLPRAEGPVPLKGTVLLLNAKKDAVLTIAAIVPAMPKPPTITFFINGAKLDQFTLTKDRFEKSYKVPAAKQGMEEYAELLITTDQFRIPAETSTTSTDPRRLGVRVTKLNWAASEGIARVVPVAEAPKAEPASPAVPAAVDVEKPSGASNRGWLAALFLMAMVIFLMVLALAGYQLWRTRQAPEVEMPDNAKRASKSRA
jgi:hypothetical protein